MPIELQKQHTKTQERINPRLSTKQIETLNQFCEKNSIKSRSRVVKAALDLALTGNSDIDFSENFKIDYSREPRKTLEFKHNIKNHTDCSHCNGKLRIDREILPVKVKKIIESFFPGFRCSDPNCLIAHKNPNYSEKPRGRCIVCWQFCRFDKGNCSFCFSENSIRQIWGYELSKMPEPQS